VVRKNEPRSAIHVLGPVDQTWAPGKTLCSPTSDPLSPDRSRTSGCLNLVDASAAGAIPLGVPAKAPGERVTDQLQHVKVGQVETLIELLLEVEKPTANDGLTFRS
jgi:hypothetical protein